MSGKYKCWVEDSLGNKEHATEVESFCHEYAVDEAIKWWERRDDGWEWLESGLSVYVSDGKITQRFYLEEDRRVVYYANKDEEYEHKAED